MSYRTAGDLNVGGAVASKVISNIPIVGGLMATLLSFTDIFEDPSVAIARWQQAMAREYQLGRYRDPTSVRASFLSQRRAIRSRFGMGP